VLTRFLLGPAGSGKTFRCLGEIRDALRQLPDGPPLILLAPKQATFQLERQLLAQGGWGERPREPLTGTQRDFPRPISGFTRLHIFSFDKLARFVLEQLNVAPPALLSGEGRVMVLRALLMRHEAELKLFGRSARRPGFAQELSGLLAELQQHQFTPAKLRSLAGNEKLSRELRHKLGDLALLHEYYARWLTEHQLQDADCLLEHAIAALATSGVAAPLRFQQLWLDGFAEMTPQELALLAAVVPLCQRATLAFCLETEPTPETSWLSIWSSIGKTFQQCRAQITNLPGCEVAVEILPRVPAASRFTEDSPLAELEQNWSLLVHNAERRGQEPETSAPPNSIQITLCANPEAEAALAAREILQFVRAGNGRRFRDCAVLVRHLDPYHKPLARAFRRYGLPFFLDRRESVTHHPLAELTRSALRTAAFDWQPDDWFAALKAGFAPVSETEIDRLENTALEFGWRGKKWREPLPDDASERLRKILLPPFEKLGARLTGKNASPTGGQLAGALRELWNDLRVESQLQAWSDETSAVPAQPAFNASTHASVFEQMNAWLDNLTRAFPHEPLPLREWLPILEAGLAGLTVGVIPPALDQVLIGAIDRARNPDLKFSLVLGANESVFPATPAAPAILTHSDRDELETQNALLGPGLPDRVSRERYLGYIACTRASERLALIFSRQSANGKTLNPSPFIGHVQKIFPALAVEEFSGAHDWRKAEHVCELTDKLVVREIPHPDPLPSDGRGNSLRSMADNATRHHPAPRLDDAKNGERFPLAHRMGEGRGEGFLHRFDKLLEIPTLQSLAEKLTALREPVETENLSHALAGRLYGPVLRSSVSRLEEFAECPFKFFARSGLRASERKVFELDARERGNFQHDVLKEFHEQLTRAGQRWRDLTPVEARERIGQIAAARLPNFRDGLFRDSAETLFAARAMTSALQDFVEVIVGWMREQYEFDPAAAELGFGGKDDPAPAWEMDLGEGRKLALQGRIDRVDLWREPHGDTALAVVTDYKSGGKKLDPLLVANGVQLQLLAYLGALRHWQKPDATFGVKRIQPAGAFYVSLRGKFEAGDTRDEILDDREAKKLAYRHNGRFDAGHLRKLDRRPDATKGDQFSYRLNKGGELSSNSAEGLSGKEFAGLLDNIEAQLRDLGQRIFAGEAQVDPYRKGKMTPCEYCDYRAACRIDEWTHAWRVLRATDKSSSSSSSSS
jgi:ATP-dependent helicase/nuclease subunit B